MKFHLITKKLILAVAFLFSITLQANSEELYTIQGKIVSNLNKDKLAKIPVVLLRFDTSITQGIPMAPIQRSETNSNGEYIFKNITKEPSVEYLIGALINGQRIASARIKLKDNLTEILNIEFKNLSQQITNVSFDLNKITYQNTLLVFNLLKDAIRITTIINLLNTSQSDISSKENPLKIKLPSNYSNFQTFEIDSEKLTAEIKENEVLLNYQVKLGKSALYFEYDLKLEKNSLTYDLPIFEQGNGLNLLYDPRYLDIVTLGQTIEKSEHGKYTLGNVPIVANEIETLTFIVKKKLHNRNILYILGTIFFILMLCSMTIFLLRKKSKIYY